MEDLGPLTGKAVKCFKWILIGHSSRILEDSVAESIVNCGGTTKEVLEGKQY